MTDPILSALRRVAQTYPVRGVQDAVIAAITEIERLRQDLAAARAALQNARFHCQRHGDVSAIVIIDAALAEDKE